MAIADPWASHRSRCERDDVPIFLRGAYHRGYPATSSPATPWSDASAIAATPKQTVGVDAIDRYLPIELGVAVSLRSLIAGHGQGKLDNCTEFCPRNHSSLIGEQAFLRQLGWVKPQDFCGPPPVVRRIGLAGVERVDILDAMTVFGVRPAQPQDREGIDELLARSYPPLLAPAYDAELLAAVLPAMTRANPKLLGCATWFVAVGEAGEIVGCGGWTRERPGTGEIEPGIGHVRHFGTHVHHLRRGIARAIAAQTMATARAAGITQLDCDSTLVAERFYASLGFRTIAAIAVPVPTLGSPGKLVEFPALLMRCVVEP